MKADQAEIIANLIAGLLKNPDSEEKLTSAKGSIAELCKDFPLYK